MNKILRVILITTVFVFGGHEALAQSDSVKAFGSYWNVRSDGEHASGYSLDLWRHKAKIVGLLRVHRGLVGDPVAGLLENVVYDPRTGKLSFDAQTAWVRGYASGKIVEFPQVFRFKGRVGPRRANGVITEVGFQDGSRSVTLYRSKEWSGLQKNFRALALWQGDVQPILDRNGPKRKIVK